MRPRRAGRRGGDGARVSRPQLADRLRGSGAAGQAGRSAPQRPAARQHAVVVEQHEGQLRRRLRLGSGGRAALGGRSGQRQPGSVPGHLARRLGGAQRRLLAVVAAAREAWGRGVLAEPARGGGSGCSGCSGGRCGDGGGGGGTRDRLENCTQRHISPLLCPEPQAPLTLHGDTCALNHAQTATRPSSFTHGVTRALNQSCRATSCSSSVTRGATAPPRPPPVAHRVLRLRQCQSGDARWKRAGSFKRRNRWGSFRVIRLKFNRAKHASVASILKDAPKPHGASGRLPGQQWKLSRVLSTVPSLLGSLTPQCGWGGREGRVLTVLCCLVAP